MLSVVLLVRVGPPIISYELSQRNLQRKASELKEVQTLFCCFLFSLSPITPQTLVLNSYELLRSHFLFICALHSLDVASIQDAPGTCQNDAACVTLLRRSKYAGG